MDLRRNRLPRRSQVTVHCTVDSRANTVTNSEMSAAEIVERFGISCGATGISACQVILSSCRLYHSQYHFARPEGKLQGLRHVFSSPPGVCLNLVSKGKGTNEGSFASGGTTPGLTGCPAAKCWQESPPVPIHLFPRWEPAFRHCIQPASVRSYRGGRPPAG